MLIVLVPKVIRWNNELSECEDKSVAATFNRQLEALEQQYPDASNPLKILTFSNPESIPLDMLVTGANAISESRLSDSVASPQGKGKKHTPELRSLVSVLDLVKSHASRAEDGEYKEA
jgi:hypothetical protein